MGINVTSPPFDKKHASLIDVATPHTEAELVAGMCSEAEADAKILTHKNIAAAHHAKTVYGDVEASVEAEIDGKVGPDKLKSPAAEAGDWVTPDWGDASSGGTAPDDISQTVHNTSINLYAGSMIRGGQKITLSGTITEVTLIAARFGDPTGTVYCRIRKVSDDSIIATSPTTKNAGTLPTGYGPSAFAFDNVPVDEEVRITLEYDGGDASNYVITRYTNTNVIAGVAVQYDTAWADITGGDLYIGITFAPGTAILTIDEDTGTNWVPVPENEAGAWISWDLGSLKFLQGIRIYFGADAAYRPVAYHIQVSKDAATWVTIITETEAPGASAWKEWINLLKWTRYVKIIVDTHGASGTKIYEVDLYSVDLYTALEEHGHG